MPIFENIEALLSNNNARFRVIEHEAAGKSEDVARIRGNDLSRSAKAIAIDVKMKDASIQHCIVVMPASCQLNSKVITKHFKAKSVSMTPNLFELTGCEPGTLPPFTFQDNIQLLIDSRIANLPDGEIFFNAGELTRSIALNVQDYVRITSAPVGEYAKEPESRAVASSTLFADDTKPSADDVVADLKATTPTL